MLSLALILAMFLVVVNVVFGASVDNGFGLDGSVGVGVVGCDSCDCVGVGFGVFVVVSAGQRPSWLS